MPKWVSLVVKKRENWEWRKPRAWRVQEKRERVRKRGKSEVVFSMEQSRMEEGHEEGAERKKSKKNISRTKEANSYDTRFPDEIENDIQEEEAVLQNEQIRATWLWSFPLPFSLFFSPSSSGLWFTQLTWRAVKKEGKLTNTHTERKRIRFHISLLSFCKDFTFDNIRREGERLVSPELLLLLYVKTRGAEQASGSKLDSFSSLLLLLRTMCLLRWLVYSRLHSVPLFPSFDVNLSL